MNEKKAKRLRKYILKNMDEVLFLIRNEFGALTEEMGPRAVYQNAKKLYYQGKLNV
jgi:hypothetical protein